MLDCEIFAVTEINLPRRMLAFLTISPTMMPFLLPSIFSLDIDRVGSEERLLLEEMFGYLRVSFRLQVHYIVDPISIT